VREREIERERERGREDRFLKFYHRESERER